MSAEMIAANLIEWLIAGAALVTVWITLTRATRERFAAVYAKLDLSNKELVEVKLELADRTRVREVDQMRQRLENYIDKRIIEHEKHEAFIHEGIKHELIDLKRIINGERRTRP